MKLSATKVLPIGLDIGSDSIKMLQLEVSQEKLSVRGAARRDVPEEARGNPELRLPVAIDLVRQMLRQHDFHGRSVVTALPRDLVQVKNVRLPKIPPSEIEAAVQFEAQSLFSCTASEAQVRHLYAGEVRQGNETKQELIVLAARNPEINDFVEQLHRGGCLVESLDFEPCAVYRSAERFIRRREDESEVLVLVDVGLRCTQVIIGRGREMSFYKPIDIGGRHLNESVSRKLEITTDEARQLRRRIAGDVMGQEKSPQDPVRQAVFDATRSVMDELAREISLCLRYYSVTFRGQRPGKLRLLGGEASDPQLQSILAGALPIPIERSHPLQSVDTTRMSPVEVRSGMSEWAVAFGLGLKLTREYFGASDGRQRTEGPAAGQVNRNTSGFGAEVVDLSRPTPGEPLTAAAIAAASPSSVRGEVSPPRPSQPEEALHA